MVRVGLAGLGFIGIMHAKNYLALDNVELAAVCDVDENKLKGAGVAGNIEGTEEPLDLTGVELYTDFDEMLSKANLDAVSITLPTFLHAEHSIKALKAGVNVLCEKPMAIDVAECEQMIAAAKESGKVMLIGHCLRFWPEYIKTKEIIDSGKYGKVKAASFQRFSQTPTWSWGNWMMGSAKSGGAALDLHIHDADFVQYLFGMPKAVYSRGAIGPSGDYDHIVAQYVYDDNLSVVAEGGWMMTANFGFKMAFHIALDEATIVLDSTQDPTFKIYPAEGETFTPEVEAGDGYSLEIAHFLKAVAGEKVPEIITLEQSRDTIKLVLAEKESAKTGKVVTI